MRVLRWVVGLVMVLGLVGCGAKPVVMPSVVNLRLDAALSDIKRAGYEEKVEVLGGGVLGVIDEKNWTVCEQEPAVGQELTVAPRLTVDRSCSGDAQSTPTPAVSATLSTQPSATPSTEPSATPSQEAEVLTAANNKDLAALLASHRLNDIAKHRAFVERYRGSIIEFNGTVVLSIPHGTYKTRFDFLIYQGNYDDAQPTPGPSFAFIDKNYSDLKLTGPNVPDSLREGMNITVVATVEDFVEDGGYIRLDPVSTMMR